MYPILADIHGAVEYFKQITGSTAYPLYATQSPSLQRQYLDSASVFFSTNIAETSLTFPHLKYVVDTGKSNVPLFNMERFASETVEIFAAKSTVKQRLGRLGRTMPGTYY